MSYFVRVRRLSIGAVARHLRPWLPSSVAAVTLDWAHTVFSSFRNRSSVFVFAPVTNVNCSAFGANCWARNSSGAVPVPPAAIRILPWCGVKLFPNGPRTPITSPHFKRCSARVASPTALTATETVPSATLSILRGISSTRGIQSIRNWPGLALAQSVSLTVKVFTVGLSVVTLTMRVTRMVLAAVR